MKPIFRDFYCNCVQSPADAISPNSGLIFRSFHTFSLFESTFSLFEMVTISRYSAFSKYATSRVRFYFFFMRVTKGQLSRARKWILLLILIRRQSVFHKSQTRLFYESFRSWPLNEVNFQTFKTTRYFK